jgi:hypothetical protein
MSLRRTWIVALPVVALAIAGCGGGGGGDTSESTPTTAETTTSALSKAELIEQGDAICAEVNAAVGAIKPESSNADARIADLYSGMVKSLEKLGPPEEAEVKYGEFQRTAGDVAVAENEVKLAAERGSSRLEEVVERAEVELGSFQSYAAEYGFKDCGEEPSTPTTSSSPGSEAGEAETGGAEPETVEPEPVEPEVEEEAAPEAPPETGGAEGGGGSGAPESGGGSTGGSSGGIGPG